MRAVLGGEDSTLIMTCDRSLAQHQGAGRPGPTAARTLLAGFLALAGGLVLYALASTQLGLGPRLAPVAYLCLALVGTMLLVTFAVTLLHDDTWAGLALLVLWALVFSGAFVGVQVLS